MLALDIEEADLPEVEQLRIETEPSIHVAAFYVVGEVVEIIKSDPLRLRIGRARPFELFRIGRASGTVAVDEIEQRAAYSFYGRNRQGLVSAFVWLGAEFHGVFERLLCIDHAPRHRRGAGTVRGDE